MCLQILRDAGAAFAAAAKTKRMSRTVITLLEGAALGAIAVFLISLQLSSATLMFQAGFAVSAFLLFIVLGFVFGYILKTATTILGGKGALYEGLTTVSYALVPFTLGFLITAVLTFVPVAGAVLGIIVMALFAAMSLAILYRGVKEMFKVDLLTSFISVSILTIAFIIGLYATLGLNVLSNIGRMLPIA